MTSFRFDIGARARTSGRLFGRIRGQLLKAVEEQTSCEQEQTRQKLAGKLGISRSLLDGVLAGRKALSLRTLADLAWALDREVVVELRTPSLEPGRNAAPVTSTTQVSTLSKARFVTSSTTLPAPRQSHHVCRQNVAQKSVP